VAENARKNAGRSGGFDLTGRKLFKMSLGRAGMEDHIFDAAIEGGYAVLGWGGDVDWSDPRYDEWSQMLNRWQQEKPEATGNDPNVVQMWPFRTAMKPRDLVIVSAGNSHFRAIGEVTGPYRFEPTDTDAPERRAAPHI
jgi:5-methylcytosine-specific restriction protein B